MKRLMLFLISCLLMVGCGPDANHPFFKPEISGATYAVPKNETQNVKAELDINIKCPGSEYGHMPCIDMDGTWEGWGYLDNDATYCAPRLER